MVQVAGDAKPERIVVVEQMIFAVEIDKSAGIVDPALLRRVMNLWAVSLRVRLGLARVALPEGT